jgi:Ala-tRNA(Pro) deacylase
MSETVLSRIETLLTAAGIGYTVLRHEPVYTSEQAAAIRGTSLASGAKALICKADQQFLMFVIPAHLRLDSKRARKTIGTRQLRFATREEVLLWTGLTPGSIPPFGSLFGLPTWCDQRLVDQPVINFNAGDHCVSLSLATHDYMLVEKPARGDLGSDAAPSAGRQP